MNLNSDKGGNLWQGFNAAVMINGFNYCAENISAVTKSGIANPGGRVKKITEPYFATTNINAVPVTENFYDKYGRKTKSLLSNGKYVETIYLDAESKVKVVVGHDANVLETITKTYNASANIIQSIDNIGNLVNFEYYSNGLLKKSWVEQSNSEVPSDSSSVLNSVESKSATEVIMEYDIYGNRIKLDDPNAGIITSVYNRFGELLSESNPNGYTTRLWYDIIGRVTDKSVTDTAGQLVDSVHSIFDTHFIGQITSVEDIINQSSITNYYDKLGRIIKTNESFENKQVVFEYTYDVFGRRKNVIYPNGFAIKNLYNEHGDIAKVIREDNQETIWEATDFNERGQLKNYKLGVLNATNTYNSLGEIERQQVGSIQDMSYDFDYKGNLQYRWDRVSDQKEVFGYDDLDRLSSVSYYKNGINIVDGNQNYQYDHFGNLTDKTLGNTFYSGKNRNDGESSGPHALDSVSDALNFRNFIQNQLIAYNNYNKITNIVQDGYNYQIKYGFDGQRIYSRNQKAGFCNETRYYFGLYEEYLNGNTGEYIEYYYIPTPTGISSIFIKNHTENSTELFHILTDYLGSVQYIVGSDTSNVKKLSFDAWGVTRSAEDWTITTTGNTTDINLTFINNRGFTGHEHLLVFDLINMNGRVYDPLVKRFLSPDPYIQFPELSQNFNRYAYCLNNPLKYIDPSGEIVWMPIIIGAAFGAFQGAMIADQAGAQGFGEWAGYIVGGAAIGGLAGWAGGAIAGVGGGPVLSGMGAGAIGGSGFTALAGGNGSDILRGGVYGAISGGVGGGVGSAIGGGPGAFFGGVSSNVTGQLLANDGDLSQVNWGSSVLTGAVSYGVYHAMSYNNYIQANKKIGFHEVSYKGWNKINSDIQRSMFWRKENGGYIDSDGNVTYVDKSLEHKHAVEFNRSTSPANVKAAYHTHWQKPGKIYNVMPNGMDSPSADILMNGKVGVDYIQGKAPVGFSQTDLNNMRGYNYLFTRKSTYTYYHGNTSPFAQDYFLRFFLFPF